MLIKCCPLFSDGDNVGSAVWSDLAATLGLSKTALGIFVHLHSDFGDAVLILAFFAVEHTMQCCNKFAQF